jgi:hypothetical protein
MNTQTIFFFFKVISANNKWKEIIFSFVGYLCLKPIYLSLINTNSSESAFNLLLSIDVKCFPRQLKIEISLLFLGSLDFSLFLNMGIIFPDNHVGGTNIQLNDIK